MNDTAEIILQQLEVRKALLLSLQTSGYWVMYDSATNLCHGEVCGAPALVPVEHAKAIKQSEVNIANARGVVILVTGTTLEPMAEVVATELYRLGTEMAWVRECGGVVN